MGTAKNGAHNSTSTRHELRFIVPSGVTRTLKTVRDATVDASHDQAAMHGDGSVAPITVVGGHGEIEWNFSLAEHEYNSAIVAVAAAAGITLSDLQFDIVKTSVVSGLPKSTNEALGCSIGTDNHSVDAEGNRRELSGMARNERINGVLRYREVQ